MSEWDEDNGTRFDMRAIRRGAQQIAAARGITTDAAWSAFIDARPFTGGTVGPLSANPSIETIMRAFLKQLISIV